MCFECTGTCSTRGHTFMYYTYHMYIHTYYKYVLHVEHTCTQLGKGKT